MPARNLLRRLVLGALVAVLVTGPVATGCAPSNPVAEPADAPSRSLAGAPDRPGAKAPDGPLPTVRMAPYVDLTTPPLPRLTDVADATGHRDLVLAFVLAGTGGCDRPGAVSRL